MVQPFYGLMRVKSLVSRRRYRITQSALRGAFAMGFDDADVVECVTEVLDRRHFYKTMPARKAVGLMQDVYKLIYQGRRIYLKLQISRSGYAVVISFKPDESGSP